MSFFVTNLKAKTRPIPAWPFYSSPYGFINEILRCISFSFFVAACHNCTQYYQYKSMSSRDFPSSEGVEMVLQAGVARLGLPSRHATDIPPSRTARTRMTKTQCIKQCNFSRQCTQSTQHKHEHRALHSRTGTNMSGHAMFTRGSHASCA